MWVLSIVLTDRAATTIPPTSASTKATATPIRVLRDFIIGLLVAPVRARRPRRGQGDRPARGWARVSRRPRALRAPAGLVVGLRAAGEAAAPGTGSSRGRVAARREARTAG